MALQAEFERWTATLASPPAVKFMGEEDGVATLVFGNSNTAVLTVTPIIDGSEANGFFVEVVDEEAPANVESWVMAANDVLMDKPKMPFADAIDKLVKIAPKDLMVGLDSSPTGTVPADDDEFEDEDDDYQMLVEDEDENSRKKRREEYAKKLADDQEEEKIEGELQAATASSTLSRQAQQVLMRDMKSLLKLKGDGTSQALQIDMVGDRLDHWRATLHADSFPNSELKRDLEKFASQHNKEPAIIMDILFPANYPLNPPFIRVIRPRFLMHTGHVTIGGSVCMEALTPSGWLPTFSLENIFVEIRSQMVEGSGRLDLANSGRDYSEAEAREAFNRVASRYGWLTPK